MHLSRHGFHQKLSSSCLLFKMANRIINGKLFWILLISGFLVLILFGDGEFPPDGRRLRRFYPFSLVSKIDRSAKLDRKPFQMAVYYSSFSVEARKFIVDQLVPTMEKLSYYFGLTLVPFGDTDMVYSNDHTVFICEHGSVECAYNKYHSCMLNQTVNDDLIKAKMVGCLFEWIDIAGNKEAVEESIVVDEVKRCANRSEFQLRLYSVKKCAEGAPGTNLLRKNGRITDRVKELLMPAITIDDQQFNPVIQQQMRANLFGVLCEILSIDPINQAATMGICGGDNGEPDFPQLYDNS